MTSMATRVSRGGPYTWADLDDMPDDGQRYEIIDGVLFVSPSPSVPHQRVVGNMHLLLRGASPPTIEVLMAPLDVAIADDTVIEPDLVVAPVVDYAHRGLIGRPPTLAVEVLSPSTRRTDLRQKKDRLEVAGCPSYWVVDPDEPSITVWELVDGSYVERAHAVGEETCSVTLPFPLEIRPQDLVDPPR